MCCGRDTHKLITYIIYIIYRKVYKYNYKSKSNKKS